ncbi:MAG: DUF3995 domain-containing protein [Pseudomonadota bacterium]
MTSILATFVCGILLMVGLIHVYWAAGGTWPGTDDESLAKTVVGSNGIKAMPPRWITTLVSICILIAAILPLAWLGWIYIPLPSWILTVAMIVLTLIFLARGIGGFIPAIKKMNSEEPFATLDARYFSPLIIAVGLALLNILVFNFSGAQ